MLALMLAGAATPARAIEQTALPPVTVRSPEGLDVPVTGLSRDERWLILYLAPDCHSCDRLLEALNAWQGRLYERVVLLVAGDPAPARAYLGTRLPVDTALISWYADPDGTVREALRLQGAPALFGIRRGQIEWTISGVLNDPSTLEPVIRSWLAQ
ncbi:MAG: hypothetical protein ABIO65_04880 [Nitrospiria bacterium]